MLLCLDMGGGVDESHYSEILSLCKGVTMTASPATIPVRTENGIEPCAFVLFGATGDLTRRKIIPALFSMHTQNLLPSPFVIVAFARRDKSDESFRQEMRDAIKEFAPKLPADGPEWDAFA